MSYSEVERGAGIPRAALRNFLNGKVKEPRLEIILAAAKFLDIDVNELFLFSPTKGEEHNPITSEESREPLNPEKSGELLNKELITECVKSIVGYIGKKIST